MAKRERRELKTIFLIFASIYFLITTFASIVYAVSLIKNNINDKESVYIDYEEYEVFSTYSNHSPFFKYDNSVVIKFDHDKYAIFKTTEFIPRGSVVVIQFEEYSNGDTYASIIGVECKRLLIEKGGN